LHSVHLAAVADQLGVPGWPLVPVGYAPPNPITHHTFSVWPPGYSGLLALTYRIGGENALYWTTPVLGVLCLVTLWWLCMELLAGVEAWRRRLTAGFAAAVLATSFQQVDHTLVPMADIAAELFTVLTVALTLRGMRGRHLRYAILSGICLGVAFDVRYTQLLIAATIVALWLRAVTIRIVSIGGAARALGGTSLAASIVVAPIFWYHWVAFGNLLTVESSELQLFAIENIPANLLETVAGLLSGNEFLFLVPFGMVGIVWLWHCAKWALLPLATWTLILLGFHLPYAALRLRDVLSIFPALALVVAAGMAATFEISTRVRNRGVQVGAACCVVTAFLLRTSATLEATGPGVRYSGFGYVQPEERRAFATLAELTPSDAVIASTLNSGPIMLYAQRDAVRPDAWSSSEWLDFVAHELNSGGHLFVLDDGEQLARPLADLNRDYTLNQIAQLPVPYFTSDSGSSSREVALVEVTR
jgi:hypothetical protein